MPPTYQTPQRRLRRGDPRREMIQLRSGKYLSELPPPLSSSPPSTATRARSRRRQEEDEREEEERSGPARKARSTSVKRHAMTTRRSDRFREEEQVQGSDEERDTSPRKVLSAPAKRHLIATHRLGRFRGVQVQGSSDEEGDISPMKARSISAKRHPMATRRSDGYREVDEVQESDEEGGNFPGKARSASTKRHSMATRSTPFRAEDDDRDHLQASESDAERHGSARKPRAPSAKRHSMARRSHRHRDEDDHDGIQGGDEDVDQIPETQFTPVDKIIKQESVEPMTKLSEVDAAPKPMPPPKVRHTLRKITRCVKRAETNIPSQATPRFKSQISSQGFDDEFSPRAKMGMEMLQTLASSGLDAIEKFGRVPPPSRILSSPKQQQSPPSGKDVIVIANDSNNSSSSTSSVRSEAFLGMPPFEQIPGKRPEGPQSMDVGTSHMPRLSEEQDDDLRDEDHFDNRSEEPPGYHPDYRREDPLEVQQEDHPEDHYGEEYPAIQLANQPEDSHEDGPEGSLEDHPQVRSEKDGEAPHDMDVEMEDYPELPPQEQPEAQSSKGTGDEESVDLVEPSPPFEPPADPNLQFSVSCNLHRLEGLNELMGAAGWELELIKGCPKTYLGRELWMYLRFVWRNILNVAPQGTNLEDQTRWFLERKAVLQHAFDGTNDIINSIACGTHKHTNGDEDRGEEIQMMRQDETYEYFIPTCVAILKAVIVMSPVEADLSLSMEPKGPKLKYSTATLDILIRVSGWILRFEAAAEAADEELVEHVKAFRRDVQGALNAIVRMKIKRESSEGGSVAGFEEEGESVPMEIDETDDGDAARQGSSHVGHENHPITSTEKEAQESESTGEPDEEPEGEGNDEELQNAGEVWTPLEDAAITLGMEMGEPVENLATTLGRTQEETMQHIEDVIRPMLKESYKRRKLEVPSWVLM